MKMKTGKTIEKINDTNPGSSKRSINLTNFYQDWQRKRREDTNYQYQQWNKKYHYKHQKDIKGIL